MTPGERIRQVRKTLGFTLEQFGSKLGVTKVAISNIEKGNRNLTEQMAKAICREFGVNYTWLTTGEGEVFLERDNELLNQISHVIAGGSEARKNLLQLILKLDEEDISVLDRLIKNSQTFYKR